jgi:hypothetical protein
VLKASNPAGYTVPWPYIRRQLAKSWGCKPWEVDEAPWFEVETELQIMQIEHEAAAWRKQRHG